MTFDLSSICGTVQQATVYLTPQGAGATGVGNKANLVNPSSWTETGITWNNQPDSTAQLASWTAPAAGTLLNFDVTSQAKAGSPLSIEISPNASSGSNTWVNYGSREASTYQPFLLVVTTQ